VSDGQHHKNSNLSLVQNAFRRVACDARFSVRRNSQSSLQVLLDARPGKLGLKRSAMDLERSSSHCGVLFAILALM